MAGARDAAVRVSEEDEPRADPQTTLRPVADPIGRVGRPRRTGAERLSGKERLVIAELARGRSTEEIGLVLSVSPHTVRTHVKNLMRKLGARTRAHAVAIALTERAIDLSS
jgi:DNA-binding CsgD family transcriptional regulator